MLPVRRAIVALSAVAVVAAACPASSGSTAPTYAPAPCPNPICRGRAPEFDVGAGSDCGHLTVAHNRERPSGRTIRIPVARLSSLGLRPEW